MEKKLRRYEVTGVIPNIPRRQRDACGIDLSKHSVDTALKLLHGIDPDQVGLLVCSEDQRMVAEEIGAYFQMPVILIPPEIAASSYAWAVVAPQGSYFSTPTI